MTVNVVINKTIVVAIFSMLVCLSTFPVNAALYYVDDEAGDDDNPGTSPSNAWRTVSKVNSVSLEAGDSVLFKRGGVWREQVVISQSGTHDNPIRYASYGLGPKPVIDLSQRVDNWEPWNGSIYVANVNFDVQQVFVNGKHARIAQFPNDRFLVTDEDGPRKDQFIDNDPDIAQRDIIGADIKIRARKWEMEVSRIIEGSRGTYTIESYNYGQSNWSLMKGSEYYLANKLWMLDSPGEWFYDAEEGRLYLWFPEGGPSSNLVEAVSYDYGFEVREQHDIVIDGFEIRRPGDVGILLYETTRFEVLNNDIFDTGSQRFGDYWEMSSRVGILVFAKIDSNTAPHKGVIRGNSVDMVLHAGIRGLRFDNLEVIDNHVKKVGGSYISQFSPTPSRGILITGDNVIVRGNIVEDIAGMGISFSGNNWIAERNHVRDACAYFGDCGLIYTDNPQYVGRRIVGNVLESTDSSFPDIKGIYIDEGSSSVHVYNNTIIGVRWGIFLHGGENNIVHGNTVYACKISVGMQEDNQSFPMANNHIDNNILFSKLDTFVTSITNWIDGDHLEFGFYSGNIYSNRNPDELIRKKGIGYPELIYSLESWQRDSGMDYGSYFAPQMNSSNPDDDSIILVNTNKTPIDFTCKQYAANGKVYKDVHDNQITWPVRLEQMQSKILVWTGEISEQAQCATSSNGSTNNDSNDEDSSGASGGKKESAGSVGALFNIILVFAVFIRLILGSRYNNPIHPLN